MPLKPRQEIFDTYWQFAAERQRVFYRRQLGHPAPWTNDKILLEFRFCNAFRAADRVSQYLIRHIIYGEHLSKRPEDIVFRCLLFRFFNQSETWDLLEKLYGDPCLANFDVDRWYKDMDTGMGLFGSAYMLCGIKTHGYPKKHGNYLGLVQDMVRDGLTQKILEAKSLETIYRELNKYTLVGKFLSYQIATDLNYSGVVNFEENSFTMAGPGAERGIAKCFEDTGGMSTEQVIKWMQEHQEEEFKKRGIDLQIAWLWGRPLQNIDIQNLFCETDKYCRVAFPDLDGGKKKRPKSNFRVTPGSPIEYFFPPKWKINDRLGELPSLEPLVPVNSEEDVLSWFS